MNVENESFSPVTAQDAERMTSYAPQWSRAARYLALISLLIGTVFAMSLLGPVTQVLFIAIIISFVMFIPSRAIAARTPLPYRLTVILLYIVLVVAIVILVLVIIPAFINAMTDLWTSVQTSYADLQARMEAYRPEHGIVDVLGFRIDLNPILSPLKDLMTLELPAPEAVEGVVPPADGQIVEGIPLPEATTPTDFLENLNIEQVVSSVFNIGTGLTRVLASAIGGLAGFVSNIFLALLISFLLLIDLPNVRLTIDDWVVPRYRREFTLVIAQFDEVWVGFFRGQVLIGILLAVIAYVQFLLMGVPGAAVLAIVNGIVSIIPNIGGILAIIPVGIVCLLQGSLVFTEMSNGLFTVLVLGIYMLYSQVVFTVIAPRIVGNAVKLPIALVILGIFLGFGIGGILGAFLVVPIMGTIRIIVSYVLSKILLRDPFPGMDAPPHIYNALFGAEETAIIPRQ